MFCEINDLTRISNNPMPTAAVATILAVNGPDTLHATPRQAGIQAAGCTPPGQAR